MKSALAIAVGAMVGVALAGLVAPAVILALPLRLRGPVVLWSSAAVVVATTVSFFWYIASRGGRE